jgi:hypothetical protein
MHQAFIPGETFVEDLRHLCVNAAATYVKNLKNNTDLEEISKIVGALYSKSISVITLGITHI